MNESFPIVIGQKGKPVNWKPFQERMQQRLGHVPSLSLKLSREDLAKLGFKAAAMSDCT